MRRQSLHLLANCSRSLLFGLCLTAAATAWIWGARPDWVAAADDWLQQRYVLAYRDRAMALAAETDVAARTRGYTQLVEELHWVRRQDKLADVVATCFQQLSALEQQQGHLKAAIEWLRRNQEFDDHDLLTAARCGELECQAEETRADGLERLAKLCQQFPSNPTSVQALARGQLAANRPADAARTLATALAKAIPSNLWTISWDIGEGIDRTLRRAETIPVLEGDDQVFRFSIDEPVLGLYLLLPPFHAGTLDHPRLECPGRTIDLLAARTESTMLITDGNRLASFGDAGATLTAHWDEPIPPGTPMVLRWGHLDLLPMRFDSALLHPALAQWLDAPGAEDAALATDLRRVRAQVAAMGTFEVFWCRKNEGFGGPRHRPQRVVPQPDEQGAAFHVELPVADTVGRLRIDLPDGVGVGYALPEFEIKAKDRTMHVDLASVEMLTPNHVERRGDRVYVTGGDPYFSIPLADDMAVDSIVLGGTAR